MPTFVRAMALPLFLAGTAACGVTAPPLPPPDAVIVHVVTNPTQVLIDPATVPHGDVYFSLDGSTTTVTFVERQAAPGDDPGPFQQADIDRLAAGDAQGTAQQTFETGSCSQDQRRVDSGRVRQPGSCGNLFRIQGLAPGLYALLLADPTPIGVRPVPMAILEVRP